MMKQFICCIVLALYITDALACDACGSAGSSQGLGLMPQYGKHFAGVQYQYRSFESEHPGLTNSSAVTRSSEYYQSAQIWGRYHISERIQVLAFIPYTASKQVSTTTNTNGGLGDVSAMATYAILNRTDSNGNGKHLLLAGLGVKAPTGKYSGSTATDRAGLPNMQPGTGSWDISLYTAYTLRIGSGGINTEAAYILTNANQYNYKYGNRLGASAMYFRQITAGQFQLMPQAGARYEYALHDYDNYKRRWLNEQTGGSIGYAMLGLQATYRTLGLQLSYYQPVAQQYGGGYVKAKHKADMGIFILF